MGGPNPQAVVFDFDGTIFDSETPIFAATAAALAEMGLALDIAGWSTAVGHGEDDSYAALCAAVGAVFDRQEFEQRYATQDRSARDRQPALPGVRELIGELTEADVPLGIASSSPASWVESHLERLGLRHAFSVVASCDRVGGRTKPDPASFRMAAARLGADPARSVAIEDSRPGVAAALAAGLHVVVVPSEITSHTDLSAAHRRVASMADLSLDTLRGYLHPPGN